jgi:hypothetical protein
LKLSKVLEELSKGNSVKFSKGTKAIIQIQKKEDFEVVFFDIFGGRKTSSLIKNIYNISRYISLDKKGLKELGFSKENIKELKKYSFDKEKTKIKIFKRPIRKNAGATPINDALEKFFSENKFSFFPEFKTYRLRIRSIADFISIEENEIVVYEVKSDVDSFLRLEKQVKDYLTYADKVYIVLHEKKLKSFFKDFSHLLEYCGLIIFDKNGLRFEKSAPKNNPKQKRKLLLSKEELSVLKQFKGYTKVKNKVSFFKEVFLKKEIDIIVCNILSDRFDKRRNKIYKEGCLTLDLSYKKEAFDKFLLKNN